MTVARLREAGVRLDRAVRAGPSRCDASVQRRHGARHGNKDFVGFVTFLVFEVAQFFKAGQTGLALGLAGLGVLARPFQFLLQGLGTRLFTFLLLLQASALLFSSI